MVCFITVLAAQLREQVRKEVKHLTDMYGLNQYFPVFVVQCCQRWMRSCVLLTNEIMKHVYDRASNECGWFELKFGYSYLTTLDKRGKKRAIFIKHALGRYPWLSLIKYRRECWHVFPCSFQAASLHILFWQCLSFNLSNWVPCNIFASVPLVSFGFYLWFCRISMGFRAQGCGLYPRPRTPEMYRGGGGGGILLWRSPPRWPLGRQRRVYKLGHTNPQVGKGSSPTPRCCS